MSAFGARRAKSAAIDVLPPDPRVARRGQGGRRPAPEVVDADFVVLPARPAAAKGRGSPGGGHSSGDGGFDRRVGPDARGHAFARLMINGGLALLRLVERGLQLLPSRAFGAVVAGSFAVAFFFAGGLSALATVFSGGVADDGGLSVADVSSSLDDRDGMKVLSVYGTVENRARDARPLSAIRVEVIAGGRTVARHRIETAAKSMAPGAIQPFTLKIPHTGSSLPKVEVSLVADALRR